MMVGGITSAGATKPCSQLTLLFAAAASSAGGDATKSTPSSLTLYGHPGTRSPLVNWAAYELGLGDSLKMGNLQENPHPFQKIPCLTDDDGSTVVFESGAILEYLQDHYGGNDSMSRSDRASITSWIVWANASLDPVCFIETPQGKVIDTSFKYGHPRLDQLNTLLASRKFLLGDTFSLADVAVASYLLYVPQFFPNDLKLDLWPHMTRYMSTCASRESYGKAFGKNVQTFLMKYLDSHAKATQQK